MTRIANWFLTAIVYRFIIIASWVFGKLTRTGNDSSLKDLWEGLKHPPEEPFS